MKKLITILLLLITAQLGFTATHKDYLGTPLADALVDFSKNNPEAKLNFIYDELEHYKVKGRIRSDNPADAIREMVALNPVKVTESGDGIFIEAMQKGKYRYSGRTVSALTGEPVDYASVVLLNPKDSTVVTYGVSDGGGYFSIPCDRKDVIAKFSSVGYKTLYKSSPSFSMGNIKLNQSAVKLNQITATAESQYALYDRLVFIPSGREKKAANTGLDLLRFMAIPTLSINPIDKSVSTISGNGVALFIDNIKASAEDVKNMRPEDVKRVEVLDYPADPRFEGAPHVVNFIMVKYEYGGYTKLDAQENAHLEYGDYSVSSKFTYKKMTYDIYGGYNYYKSNKDHINAESKFDFSYGEVTENIENIDSHNRNNNEYITARAKYVSDKSVISNQISINYFSQPNDYGTVMNRYTPSIYPDGIHRSNTSYFSLNPSWRGDCQLTLPRSLTMVITPTLTYSHNNSHSFFTEKDIENISNVKENAWQANIGVGISKSWNRNSLTFTINGELKDNDLNYTGNNPDKVHYFYEAAGAFLRGTLNFGILRLQPSVKFFFSKTKFCDQKYYQSLPGYYIAGSLNFNRKHQLQFDSEMSYWNIGVPYRSPNIVVQSLLQAKQGNPSLKNWLYNSAEINYTWLPSNAFNLTAYGSYIRHTKPVRYNYTHTEINGREMMLCSYIKDGYFQTISSGLSATYRLLKNSLILNGNLGIRAYRNGGLRRYDCTALTYNLSASYYIKDFYFYAFYSSAQNQATQYVQERKAPSYYGVNAGWAKYGLNISIQLANFFRSNYNAGSSFMSYDNYSTRTDYFNLNYHRGGTLNISYTINYGKKVQEERLSRGSSVSSGIVQ